MSVATYENGVPMRTKDEVRVKMGNLGNCKPDKYGTIVMVHPIPSYFEDSEGGVFGRPNKYFHRIKGHTPY